jgi:hypothetical protein
MLQKVGSKFTHVIPGDTESKGEGLRDFFCIATWPATRFVRASPRGARAKAETMTIMFGTAQCVIGKTR